LFKEVFAKAIGIIKKWYILAVLETVDTQLFTLAEALHQTILSDKYSFCNVELVYGYVKAFIGPITKWGVDLFCQSEGFLNKYV